MGDLLSFFELSIWGGQEPIIWIVARSVGNRFVFNAIVSSSFNISAPSSRYIYLCHIDVSSLIPDLRMERGWLGVGGRRELI